MKRWLVLVLCAACGGSGPAGSRGGGGGGGGDAASERDAGSDSSAQDARHGTAADGGSSGFTSTLTSPCATLQGRAIVSYNDNLGIAFTDDDSPYSFRGSVQFELPDGFTGDAPNPEDWDGSGPRHVIAMTDVGFDLHGNHCWNGETPPAGTLVIEQFDTSSVIVSATFDQFPMHSCTDDTVCTVSGTITTTGAGVFD
jgi:hypothetical protein